MYQLKICKVKKKKKNLLKKVFLFEYAFKKKKVKYKKKIEQNEKCCKSDQYMSVYCIMKDIKNKKYIN